MPTYGFKDLSSGETLDLYVDSIVDAPDVGDVIEVNGRRLERVWDLKDSRSSFHVSSSRQFVAQSLPPVVDSDGIPTGHWDPGKIDYVKDRRSTDYGQPVIDGPRDVQAIEKASDGEWVYDPQG